MAYKTIITLFLIGTLGSYAKMKCEAGKCQIGKCEVGKCGAALIHKSKLPKKERQNKNLMQKQVPQKEDNSTMKCQSGKCGAAIERQSAKAKSTTSKKPTIKQLFNVRTVEVKVLQSSKKQSNYGYIVAQDPLIVDVTAWFSGYVKELYVDSLYQKVQRGDALALVYSPEVYKAKQDYLNAIRFHAKRSSPAMVHSAKTKLLLLGVSQTEILQVSKKSEISKYTTIYAPTSGWIFEKNIHQGSYINSKKSLYKITDLSKVWLEVKLFQNELSSLHHMQHFTVSIKGLDRTYKAKKELLYPALDPKEATATLRLSLDNEDGFLKPGMYAKVDAYSTYSTKVVIPRTAVIRKSGVWYVFLATEFQGEYEPLAVELKPLDSKHFQVTKGLKVGDKVVNNALFMMDSDAQINSIY